MTEILTESFCERCGTRYTFETARPRNSRFGRAKTFTKGLRNYVLSDDSFSEAMADARGEDELAATVVQLDAFHKTFNFCLDCRQYTCSSCWNAEEGRCLSCAPRPGTESIEDLGAGGSAAIAERLATLVAPPADARPEGEPIGISAWPAVDLPAASPEAASESHAPGVEPADLEPEALTGSEAPAAEAPAPDLAVPQAAAGPVTALPQAAAPTPVESPPAVPSAEPSAKTTADRVEAPAEPEPVPGHPALQGLKPGESLDDALAAYEATHALDATDHVDAAAAPDAEPAVAVVPQTTEAPPSGAPDLGPGEEAAQPEGAAAAADVAAPPVPEPEPVAREAAPVAPLATEPEPFEPAPAPAAVESVLSVAPPPPPLVGPPTAAPQPTITAAPAAEQPIAATALPSQPGPAASPDEMAAAWLTVAPDDGTAPAWPQRPTWPVTPRSMEGATLAGRRLLPSKDAAALWAASAREVVEGGPLGATGAMTHPTAAPTAQPCVGCGLSLSANARFCRRCGARQG
jgi:hypothetical protein